MEVYPLGPCTLIDTAGFNDETELGEERLEKTKLAAEKTDIAIILLTDTDMDEELHWYEYFREKKTSVIWVIGKADFRMVSHLTLPCAALPVVIRCLLQHLSAISFICMELLFRSSVKNGSLSDLLRYHVYDPL